MCSKLTRLTVLLVWAFVVVACSTHERSTSVALADKSASELTKSVYGSMQQLASKGIMLGHQDALAYGIGWFDEVGRCDFKDAAGDYPAVFGWDIGHLELGHARNLDSVDFGRMADYIKQVHAMGGINTLSWHANNPLTGGSAWDAASKEVVKEILPGGSKHQLYLSWLDRVASFMLQLKASDGEAIPVLFRPYHELSGNWFWWCQEQCTVDEYVGLWRMTFDYLHTKKKVHNIIWVYSMAGYNTMEEFMQRYPGDTYVDLIGFDAYQHKEKNGREIFTGKMQGQIKVLLEAASITGKLAAITEVGYEGIPQDDWFTSVIIPLVEEKQLSYLLLWRNAYTIPGHFYAPYSGHSSSVDLKKMTGRSDVLTLRKIELDK